MANNDKTEIVSTPGADPQGKRGPANLDDISTQVVIDQSNRTVGMLTVVDGDGKGQSRPIFSGTNQVGRSADNRIPLDFGDKTISRLQHAVIAYDATSRVFTIHDGGKQNPILVNGEKLAGNRDLIVGDLIKIGMTTLRFSLV